MSKYHLEHAKYSKWLKSHTFENCKLDRKEYGHFIADYISGEKDGFVLNINGAWGSGKTEFLKRLYTLFINKRTPTIYINAWESDFSKDPLTVVTSELLEQLSLFNENIGEDLKTVKSLLGRVIKGSFYGAAGFTTHKLLGDATIGSDLAKELLNDESSIKFIDELKGSYLVQTSAISEIRIQLGQLAEVLGNTREAQLPVIVLVDELDRCRPDYAIEMLEVIKHFFHTKNFVFIIATDTKQLSNSMNAVYGNKFDSIKYLRRFFDREATLPEPDIVHYLNIKNFSLEEANNCPNITIAPDMVTNNSSSLRKYVSYFIRAYHLDIRDLDQILAKLESCLRSIISIGDRDQSRQVIDFFMLLTALLEHHSSLITFDERTDKNKLQSEIPSDLTIAHDLNISTITTLSLTFSSLHRRDASGYGARMHQNDIYLPVSFDDFEDRSGTLSNDKVNFLHGYTNALNTRASNGSTKHWLWSHYKKLVTLAGTID